jgi:hypothetical protein
MTKRFYVLAMGTMLSSIFVMPDWDTMTKMYAFSMIGALTTIIQFLFQLQKIREWIVRMLTKDVIQEVMRHPDMNKIFQFLNNENQKELKRKKK